jgi:alkylation response protein AidB-like acyl-CoA dehydrogenase
MSSAREPRFREEHDALRETARRWVAGRLDDDDLAALAAEADGLGLFDALGGRDPLAAVVVAEELGATPRRGAATVLMRHGCVAPLLRGPGLAAVALHDEVATTTGGALSGRLRAVPGAHAAHRLVVAADGAAYELAADAAVITPTTALGLDGVLAAVTLDGVRPTARLDGRLGAVRDRLALTGAAATVAAGWRTWTETRTYALSREAFGRPVGRFQVNRHALAAAATRLTAARQLVLAAADGRSADAATAQRYAQHTVPAVADRCLQLHGGYGYASESDVQRAWRDEGTLALLQTDQERP